MNSYKVAGTQKPVLAVKLNPKTERRLKAKIKLKPKYEFSNEM